MRLSVDALAAHGAEEQASGGTYCPEGFATTSGDWRGVSLRALMDEVRPSPEARYVSVHSGPFVASFRLESLDRRQAILATSLNGEPVSWAAGGPIRLVPASGACFETVQWVERISLDSDGSGATALDIVRARRGEDAAR